MTSPRWDSNWMRDVTPLIISRVLPEEERAEADTLSMALSSLQAFEDDFRQDVALFNAHPEFRDVAGRDGAISVWNFAKAYESTAEIGKRIPTLLSHADVSKFREARKLLKQEFPKHDKVRHAVAHAGEIFENAPERETHWIRDEIPEIKKGDGRLLVSGCYKGSEFMFTWKGALLTYELSQASLDALTEVRRLVYDAFRPAAGWTRERGAADQRP